MVFPAVFNLSSLEGQNGFVVDSTGSSSVSGAGDVNADGIADIIIGGASLEEQSYVIFGQKELFNSPFQLASLNGTNGFVIDGSGSSVSGAGDGNDDIITVGNSSYVIFGQNSTALDAYLEV
jgi:hypothetical protein